MSERRERERGKFHPLHANCDEVTNRAKKVDKGRIALLLMAITGREKKEEGNKNSIHSTQDREGHRDGEEEKERTLRRRREEGKKKAAPAVKGRLWMSFSVKRRKYT